MNTREPTLASKRWLRLRDAKCDRLARENAESDERVRDLQPVLYAAIERELFPHEKGEAA